MKEDISIGNIVFTVFVCMLMVCMGFGVGYTFARKSIPKIELSTKQISEYYQDKINKLEAEIARLEGGKTQRVEIVVKVEDKRAEAVAISGIDSDKLPSLAFPCNVIEICHKCGDSFSCSTDSPYPFLCPKCSKKDEETPTILEEFK